MQFGCHFSDNIDRVLQVQKQNHFVDLCHTGGTNVDLVPSIELWRWKKTIWYVFAARNSPIIPL